LGPDIVPPATISSNVFGNLASHHKFSIGRRPAKQPSVTVRKFCETGARMESRKLDSLVPLATEGKGITGKR
jgi:hypothetical protein